MKKLRKIPNELAELRNQANKLRKEHIREIGYLLDDCYHLQDIEKFEVVRYQNNSFDLNYICGSRVFVCTFNFHSKGLAWYKEDEFIANLQSCGNIKHGSEDYERIYVLSKLMQGEFLRRGLILMRKNYDEMNPLIEKITKLDNKLKSWDKGIGTYR